MFGTGGFGSATLGIMSVPILGPQIATGILLSSVVTAPLRVNTYNNKNNVFHIHTEYLACNSNDLLSVRIGGNMVERTDQFKYLGSTLHASGDIDCDVKAAAWAKWRERPEGRTTMADIGISQAELVENHRDNARKLPQYIAAIAATLGALAAGSMLGWSAPVMVKIVNTTDSEYDFPITPAQGDWISSIINLGAAFICFPIGLIMDRIGRKTSMLLLVIPFTLGWLLITFGNSVGMLIAGRFITGLAGGAFCVTAPAYTSEIAQDSIRGALGSYFQLMITVGILFSYAVGSYTSVFVFNILCTIIPIVFGIIFFFMPESPRYLVVKGKNDQARQALIRLRGQAYDVDYELDDLKMQAENSKANPVSYLSALTKRTAIKAIIICYCLMFFQQLSGINAVIFNASQIFTDAGATIPSEVATIIIGVIQVCATFVSSLVVDKLGRRILLMLSTLFMCICSTALGVYFFLQEQESDVIESIAWLPLVSLSIFIIAFSIGLGPIPWIMSGDLCRIEIKAFVGSTAGTLNWLLSFTVTVTFNSLNSAIGAGQVFWLFAGIMLIGFIFVFFILPETKGKSVEEIQLLLGAKPETSTEDEK